MNKKTYYWVSSYHMKPGAIESTKAGASFDTYNAAYGAFIIAMNAAGMSDIHSLPKRMRPGQAYTYRAPGYFPCISIGRDYLK